jgi:dihydrofolate reductase
MKFSAYIAISTDGFIAKKDGNVDWLQTSGKHDANMEDHPCDMGFATFMSTLDCMIMGRKSMEKLNDMNVNNEKWPYGKTRIVALSRTLKEAPAGIKDRLEVYGGDLKALVARLEAEGYIHVYVDGGMTIQSFIRLKLMNEMTITRVPILLGDGIPLFGTLPKTIQLENCSVVAFPNDFIQEKYTLKYE